MLTLDQAIERATDRINLKGAGCDVYSVLYQYKAIRELDEEKIDQIYDWIVHVLGF